MEAGKVAFEVVIWKFVSVDGVPFLPHCYERGESTGLVDQVWEGGEAFF